MPSCGIGTINDYVTSIKCEDGRTFVHPQISKRERKRHENVTAVFQHEDYEEFNLGLIELVKKGKLVSVHKLT